VTLSVPDQQLTALIGPSGGGKSVLLKCAAGLLRTDAGSISILGRTDVTDWDPLRPNIGVLFQRNALFDSMTVWQNVAFALVRRGQKPQVARSEAFRLLALVGLDERTGNLTPNALSGGMRKRAALARAIAGAPKLLLLDDPTAGLDPVLAASMEQLVRYLVREHGATALIVTADVQNLGDRFDNVAILDDGRIVWQNRGSHATPDAHPLLFAA
jgi:phospholipid/cholesterol/gamma-HCH transport system ATP-binding protein